MARRVLALALFLAAQSTWAQTKTPRRMSASGDSLTQGALADGIYPGDQPWNSWLYGTTSVVDSMLMRYQASINPNMSAQTEAFDGATMMRDFLTQVNRICTETPLANRVFVLLGQNDACNSTPAASWEDAAAHMPSAADFASVLDQGLGTLAGCLPRGSVVHVVSVIRVDFLRAAGLAKSSWYCPIAWDALGICPIVTQETNATRLWQIGRRIDAWNDALASVVFSRNTGPGPHPVLFETDWSGAAVTDQATDNIEPGPNQNTSAGTYQFRSSDINGLDCFHASTRGQHRLACAEWAKSYDGAPFSGPVQGCFQ